MVDTHTTRSLQPVAVHLGPDDGLVSLVVSAAPSEQDRRVHATRELARRLGTSVAITRHLLGTLPCTLPRALHPQHEAEHWRAELEGLGFTARLVPRDPELAGCRTHGTLDASLCCARCGQRMCVACAELADDGHTRCRRCSAWRRFGRAFFLARVSLLLTVLLLVALWGYDDAKSRRARNDWNRTLSVAVVLTATEPLDPAAVAKLRERLPVLEQRLADQFQRHRSGPYPFRLVLHGPVGAAPPPAPPQDDDWSSLGVYYLRQWRYTSAIDAAAGVELTHFDSRVYLVGRPGTGALDGFVEGHGEHGGRIGIVNVQLDEDSVDLALAVTAHELLHTLGAEDKYDGGRTLLPAGLAEPELWPAPQRLVEVMAQSRPVAAGREEPLGGLEELGVGPVTAREIGWLSY